ncbi:ribosome-binding protein 1 isoform X2 [Drosophila hydei]|uniref:Ribosome-binding protein 1 isoform X2 n=1 Tax=Drosophila hydei TaxID=7224 RepID=A0A6J1LYW5_DROHY|nr:ribosome-binding protein 1 isoform X2 [Drosophila hydei]
MDFHILIVIGCVIGASLLSFLFINKIFRRKTFEEVVAEKRAMSANLYAQNKSGGNASSQRKPKKKELKREKKQRQREQQKDNASNNDQEEQDDFSDGHSEGQGSVGMEEESTQPGLSKQHVEFDPDPEVLSEQQRRPSSAEKENQSNNINNNNSKKGKKDKRNGSGPKAAVGILVNKNEAVAVRQATAEETPTLNNFEVRAPKDVVELKKQEQKERKEDNNNSTKQQAQKKNGNAAKKEKPIAAVALLSAAMEQPVEVPHVPKQIILKQQPTGSPKLQHNNVNSKNNKQQQHAGKKQKETSLSVKDLVQALDKLAENQTIGVSALMNVFSRAELNRSEIQMLIEYLLNRQQDMPANHGDWSDDICQKLKRQLDEKEKQLAEELEASIGIQAKLRELRQEINTERAQIQSRSQAYTVKLLSKDQELAALNQELASVNEKFALERQQFQAKLLLEKQASSQDLLLQLQRLQQELAQKEKVIADMSSFVNAEVQQKNEVIQQQAQQLLTLEQQRDELEARLNNSVFELEQRRQLETENAEIKEELRTLNNALESAKADLVQSQGELTRVCNTELPELRQQAATLEASNVSLNQQLNQANNQAVQAVQASAHQSEQAQVQAEALTNLQSELRTLNDTQATQQQQTAVLRSQLEEVQQRAEKLQDRERQLEQELQEQREKNNQQHKQLQQQLQQQQMAAAANGEDLSRASTNSAKAEQQRIRDLYQRLYPAAVKAHAASALNSSFEEWLQQVLATHIKQQQLAAAAAAATNSSNKSTQSSNSDSSISSDHNSSHNNINSNNSNSSSKFSASAAEQQELHTQNLKLRKRNDELTQLVTKTSNTLVDLEQRAREQDEHWRGIVSQKEQLISKLQQHASNGEQDI